MGIEFNNKPPKWAGDIKLALPYSPRVSMHTLIAFWLPSGQVHSKQSVSFYYSRCLSLRATVWHG